MMLTFGEMVSQLAIDLKYGPEPGQDVLARLRRYVNEAHRHVLRLTGMAEQREITLPLVTVAGQTTYGIAQAFDRIQRIGEPGGSRRLTMRTADWLLNMDPQNNSIGTPEAWVPLGMQAVAQQPPRSGSGLWVRSSSAADTSQQVRIIAARVTGGLTRPLIATLAGTAMVQVGTLDDIAAVLRFTLSSPCEGDVILSDSAAGPQMPLPPGTVFPNGASRIDSFDDAAQNPIAGPWQTATGIALAGLATDGAGNLVVAPTATMGASWLRDERFGADFDAYLQITGAPIPIAAYAALWLTVDRPVAGGFEGAFPRGFRLHFQAGRVGLDRWDANEGSGVPLLDMSAAPLAIGDSIGVSRRGGAWTLYRFNDAANTWKALADPVTDDAYREPLYSTIQIADATRFLSFSAFSGGPFDGRLLATIDRFAGTSQPYFAVRLWPTPTGPLPYDVTGTVRVPEMLYDTDIPHVQPEYCDLLMTYARMRIYKTSTADVERFIAERDEWERVTGELRAFSQFPPDYRPVAGGPGDRSRWSNLGGFYPPDGWG